MKRPFGIFGLAFFTILAFRLFAGSVTVSWNPNSEVDLAGYRIYYGTQSHNYDKTINVANTTSYTIAGLSEDLTYYFAVTAYDTANNESNFSEEISITLAISEQPPTVVDFRTIDPRTLRLVFSKKMDIQSVRTISHYTITPTIQISSILIDTSLTVVTLYTTNHEIGKPYTLNVQGVKDIDGIMLEGSYSTTYSFSDQMPPYVKQISLLNPETIQLHFSEPMNASTISNKANYSISPPITVLNAEVDSSVKVVTLRTARHSYEVEYILTIHGVVDTSGNLIPEDYTIPYIFAAPPTVVYFHTVDPNTLRLVFSKKMDSRSVKTISNYSITPTIQITTIGIDTSLTVVTLHTAKHEVAKTYTLNVQGVKDINGTALEGSYSTTYFIPDQRPPYVGKISLLNPEVLQLHFSEPMDVSTVSDTVNYSIFPPISVLSTEVDSSVRVITLHTSPHLYEVGYTLTIHGVVDTSENLIPENYSITYIFSAPPRITDINHSNYAPTAVKVDESYYVDRDFRISFIPEALKDLIWIKTANSDKFDTDSRFLTFSISKSATVYLGYDSRLTALPSWLESWQHTEMEIRDEGGVIFQIYSRNFAKGDVVLGGNCGTDATNMYIVLVKGSDEHIEYPDIPQDPYDSSETAEEYLLYQNFPNPFNPSTEIRFHLSEPDTVVLTIHDMLGREVRRYEMQTNSAGIFSVNWDGTNEYGLQVASGIYLYCLQTTRHIRQTKKMTLIR